MKRRDPWAALRRFTSARIGLGRVGHALCTAEVVDFAVAHASARDAVWTPWDVEAAASALTAQGFAVTMAKTRVRDRSEYLRRPDLGRVLMEGESARLSRANCDVAIVLSNGLSSTAVVLNGSALVAALSERLGATGFANTPVVLIPDARVAIGDPIGVALGARAVIVVVGERPGLSSTDGLGVYITYDPQPGNTDERRNCISNVRPDGLPIAVAAHKAAWLVREALRRKISGVHLKDEAPTLSGSSAPPVETT